MATLPPPSSRDPDIVDSAMKATRALSKADAVLMRRRSLNLELTRAEDLVREFRGSRPVR